METDHIPTGMARAYLLHQMPDEAAQALEAAYFASPSLLSELESAERKLIEDYLHGALNVHEREIFEARYLTIPALKDLVDRVQHKQVAGAQTQSSSPARTRFATLALAAFVVIACTVIYLGHLRSNRIPNKMPTATATVATSVVILHLEPGLSKGGGAKVLPLPRNYASVRVMAELPSVQQPANCTAHLSFVRDDGSFAMVWTSSSMRTTTQGSIQSLSFPIPAAYFKLGDFVLQIYSIDGQVIESYLFHVAPAH